MLCYAQQLLLLWLNLSTSAAIETLLQMESEALFSQHLRDLRDKCCRLLSRTEFMTYSESA